MITFKEVVNNIETSRDFLELETKDIELIFKENKDRALDLHMMGYDTLPEFRKKYIVYASGLFLSFLKYLTLLPLLFYPNQQVRRFQHHLMLGNTEDPALGIESRAHKPKEVWGSRYHGYWRYHRSISSATARYALGVNLRDSG